MDLPLNALRAFEVSARHLSFTLAGADRVFHPAEATLVDGRVVVRSDAVKSPVALRYGWSDNPADADLINAAGLPASPFRTDAW